MPEFFVKTPEPLPSLDIAHLVHVGAMTLVGLLIGYLAGKALK